MLNYVLRSVDETNAIYSSCVALDCVRRRSTFASSQSQQLATLSPLSLSLSVACSRRPRFLSRRRRVGVEPAWRFIDLFIGNQYMALNLPLFVNGDQQHTAPTPPDTAPNPTGPAGELDPSEESSELHVCVPYLPSVRASVPPTHKSNCPYADWCGPLYSRHFADSDDELTRMYAACNRFVPLTTCARRPPLLFVFIVDRVANNPSLFFPFGDAPVHRKLQTTAFAYKRQTYSVAVRGASVVTIHISDAFDVLSWWSDFSFAYTPKYFPKVCYFADVSTPPKALHRTLRKVTFGKSMSEIMHLAPWKNVRKVSYTERNIS